MSGSYSKIDHSRTIKCFPGKHHPLGPSGSKRWLHCAGSVNASVGSPNKDSVFSAEGTAAHTLSEVARLEGVLASTYKGWTIIVGEHKFVVDDEMIDSAQEFIDWCTEVPGEHLFTMVERLVSYGTFMPWDPAPFGTLDHGTVVKRRCTLTDFKHGKGIQEYAENNTQLMLQALGVVEELDWIYDFEDFDLRISQPRLDHKDSWIITKADLLAWAAEQLPPACERIKEGKQFKAGVWCRFCPIKLTCAVRANAAVQEVLDDFTDLDAPTMQRNVVAERAVVTRLTPARVAEILPSLELLGAWLKDVKRHAIALLVQGEKVGDWKLVEGRSVRKFKDQDAVVAKLEAADIEPWAKKLLSPSKLEKAHGKTKIKGLVGDLIDKPHGKPKLVPGADKRVAVTTEILNEFTDLDSEDDEDDDE